jgi:hypothetical protein
MQKLSFVLLLSVAACQAPLRVEAQPGECESLGRD